MFNPYFWHNRNKQIFKSIMKPFLFFSCTMCLFFMACNPKQNKQLVSEEQNIPDISAIENGLLPPVVVKGDSIETYSLEERMEYYKVPGVSIAVVKEGKLLWAKGYGVANTDTGTKVDVNTMFQAGSISKPIAALAALKLVEEGKVDLDTDVNQYLKDWKIPQTDLTENQKVTLRLLLTHSAGMTVHGFPGYKQSDTFPSIVEVLNGEGNTPKIYVDTKPNTIWRYSGGGYTVMEKVVEDVSGMPLEAYLENEFLSKLKMKNSTFAQPLTQDYHGIASAAYNTKGEIVEGLWHNYPEQAAAGLWTTPSDLAKYCIEIQEIVKGKTDGILSQETVKAMLTKHKNDWGLGPALSGEGENLLFRHGGKNEGFSNNMIAFANQGNAIIVMTSADNGGKLYGEILRGISTYYGWEIGYEVKEVEVAVLEQDYLEGLTGKYKFTEKKPDGTDYIVELKAGKNKIIVNDPNNGEVDYITPLSETEFMDISDGDYVKFQVSDPVGFLWNNYYQFYKISDEQ